MKKKDKKDTKKEKMGRLYKEFSYYDKKTRIPSKYPSEPEQVHKKIRHLTHEQTYHGTANSITNLSRW